MVTIILQGKEQVLKYQLGNSNQRDKVQSQYLQKHKFQCIQFQPKHQ